MAKSLKVLKKKAHEYVRHAQRVYHYRKDELSEANLQELVTTLSELKEKAKSATDENEFKQFLKKREAFLKSVGGRYYPRSSLVENIEMFFVAAIVAIGVRTYIIQPFQIPTNSMYPSYHGMTYKVYKEGEEPGLLKKTFLLLDRAAGQYEIVAPAMGEFKIPIEFYGEPGKSAFRMKHEMGKGRRMLVLPAPAQKFTFLVGTQPVELTVPWDFDLGKTLGEALFGKESNSLFLSARETGNGNIEKIGDRYWFNTGKTFQKGQTIASFSIFAGDALFVDRFSYHFVRPKVGDAIVFHTGKIEGLQDPKYGPPEGDKYYIKRMVGDAGDQIEIREPIIYRNGVPIEGSAAFEKNAHQWGEFNGYLNHGILDEGKVYPVPKDHVLGLGDNSGNSRDSRYFGPIPRDQVIGRALFRYYPFSRLGFPD